MGLWTYRGRRGWDEWRKWHGHICTNGELLHKTGGSVQRSVMIWRGQRRCGEAQEGGDICIHIADPFCCIAETLHNVVKQLHSKKLLKKIILVIG